ncbi:MAG: NusG domain II-containing protein [Spirochaetia bacterium]
MGTMNFRRLNALRQGIVSLVRELRLLDYVALAVALLVVLGFSLAAASGGQGEKVEIKSEEGEFVYPLEEDRELTLSGPLGTTDIVIRDGRVQVTRDPGPQQICVRQGWIENSGEWLACLPSRIFIEIQGGETTEDGIDAQTF